MNFLQPDSPPVGVPIATTAPRWGALPNGRAELSSTPARNIVRDATVCTVGMARPSVQGQVMIRTATAVA
jgi:hypothetical protein